MAMARNLAFFVAHAIKNGVTKFGRLLKSMLKSAWHIVMFAMGGAGSQHHALALPLESGIS